MGMRRIQLIAFIAFVLGAVLTFFASTERPIIYSLLALPSADQATPVTHSAIRDVPMVSSGFSTSTAAASPASAVSPPPSGISPSPSGAPPRNLEPSFTPLSALSVENTAFVTMASDDRAARLAVALMQSLRDVGTTVPHLVVLLMRGGTGSASCLNNTWKAEHNRKEVRCGSLETIEAEVVSEMYLSRLASLGVETILLDPIPQTEWTKGIPGGAQMFWGMAFNKLKVFSLTQFRKVIWLDADDFFVRNVDHLMEKPMLTGSMVTACCNGNGPAYAGGGIWVLEPKQSIYNKILETIAKPMPGTNPPKGWHFGDMDVIRVLFGSPPAQGATEPLYPAINDLRHGYVGGLRYFPAYAHMSQAEFDTAIENRLDRRKPRREGFMEELANAAFPSWRALDMRYDQCVGSFKCSPERDAPDVVFSVHFSCLQTAMKPSKYDSERDLMQVLYSFGDGHTRAWTLRWYETFKRAMGGHGLPPPLWDGPAVPGYNATHDEITEAARKIRGL